MQGAACSVKEQLDHPGIVAGGCQAIGLAPWLPTNRQRVNMGTATTALILNG